MTKDHPIVYNDQDYLIYNNDVEAIPPKLWTPLATSYNKPNSVEYSLAELGIRISTTLPIVRKLILMEALNQGKNHAYELFFTYRSIWSKEVSALTKLAPEFLNPFTHQSSMYNLDLGIVDRSGAGFSLLHIHRRYKPNSPINVNTLYGYVHSTKLVGVRQIITPPNDVPKIIISGNVSKYIESSIIDTTIRTYWDALTKIIAANKTSIAN